MTDIDELCFKIEHVVAGFELDNPMKIDEIRIIRNEQGYIKAIKAIASGEYRKEW